MFGSDFEARLVFAYHLGGPPDRWPVRAPHTFRGEAYAFFTVRLSDYKAHARLRSPRWKTVSVARAAFCTAIRPVTEFGVGEE